MGEGRRPRVASLIVQDRLLPRLPLTHPYALGPDEVGLSPSSLSDKFSISRWPSQLLQRCFKSAPKNANSSGRAISADGGKVSRSSTLRRRWANLHPSCFSAQYAVRPSHHFHPTFGVWNLPTPHDPLSRPALSPEIGDGPSKPANRCTNCINGNLNCTYVESKVVSPSLRCPIIHPNI